MDQITNDSNGCHAYVHVPFPIKVGLKKIVIKFL